MDGRKKLIRKVYLVLGMHRSGTSFVARALHLAGVDMGPPQALLGPNKHNPLGHYENAAFNQVDDQIMRAAGSRNWTKPVEIGAEHPKFGEWQTKVAEVVKTYQGPKWGFKDPRAISTLPLYLDEFEEDDVHLVCVFRRPSKVVASLVRRGGVGKVEAEQSTRAHNKILLRRLVEFLGLEREEGDP